jgi:hypothetical protein
MGLFHGRLTPILTHHCDQTNVPLVQTPWIHRDMGYQVYQEPHQIDTEATGTVTCITCALHKQWINFKAAQQTHI